MAWTVTIGEGASTLTLDANIRFDIDIQKTINEAGECEAVGYVVEVEGIIRSDTPATVGANMVTYSEQASVEQDTVRVQIKQDGTTRWDLQVEDGFNGPFVTRFRSIQSNEGGSGESHWRYGFTITFKGKGSQSGGGGDLTNELHTSLRITKQNGVVIRKVWQAEASSSSVDGALSAVMSFKPAGQYITEEVERIFKDNKATAIWVWEPTTQGGVTSCLAWRCEVTAREGRVGYTPITCADPGAAPVLFKKQRGVIRIDVRGEFTVMDPTKAVAPAPHYTESGTIHRASELEETLLDPIIHDEKKGTYTMRYHEVWFCTDATPPKPNHAGSHNIIGGGSAPGDGAIGG
jgi:hypothetical protein